MQRSEKSHQTLDPCSLGRPVQLLQRYAAQLAERQDQRFDSYRRRHGADLQLGLLEITPCKSKGTIGRWWLGETALGRVACTVDRSLLLTLMAHRFGGALDLDAPETSTEERLAETLCQQWLADALELIDPALPSPQLVISQQPQLSAGSWLLRLPVIENGEIRGALLLALSAGHINLLLQLLAASQPARPAKPRSPEPLARRLPLKLEARLLEQQLTLDELLALRPGQVLPIRLKDASVRVGGAVLFNAAVAEHQGKLHLTSFTDCE